MFKTLIIRNFQNITELRIDFDSQLSVIIGPTDVGKSASLRALEWVCTNTPEGEDFIRRGATQADVTLVMTTGEEIRRLRGKGVNSYFLDGKEFKAFGRSAVPPAIEKILNVGETNFQGQLDSIYWFSLSSSEVSRQLNSVVDLSVIDDSLEEISKRVRAAKSTVSVSRDRLTTAKEKKLSLDWVVEADREYSLVEKLKEEADQASQRFNDLYAAVEDVRLAQQTVDVCRDRAARGLLAVDLATQLIEIEFREQDLRNTIDSAKRLRLIVRREVPDFSQVSDLKSKLEDQERRCRELSNLIESIRESASRANRVVPDFSEVELKHQAYVTATKKLNDLQLFVTNQLKVSKEMYAQKKQFSDDLAEQVAAASVDFCPVCGKAT